MSEPKPAKYECAKCQEYTKEIQRLREVLLCLAEERFCTLHSKAKILSVLNPDKQKETYMSDEEQTSTTFDEGYEAASSAMFLEDNPHLLDSTEYDQWEDGWWSFFYSEDEEC